MLIPGHTEPRDRLIVALDVPTRDEAQGLIDQLDGTVSFFKVGFQLLLAEGMDFVRELLKQDKRVFLDLKMDDVDETIIQGVREISRVQVHFLTIHGNRATARAAITGRDGSDFPKILSLTLLSSLDQQDLVDLQIVGKKRKFTNLRDYVLWRGDQAIDAGCEGLIASGDSIAHLRGRLGDKPIIVSPGIRPKGLSTDDHKRFTTPRNAIRDGADYLVVGRPIRNADNPSEMARAIVDEIEQGLTVHV